MGRGEVGDFLADGGAVVGGGAALGTVLAFMLGTVVHAIDERAHPETWARYGALTGGLGGLVVLINGL